MKIETNQIFKRKKRRVFAWLFVCLSIFVIIIVLALVYGKNNDNVGGNDLSFIFSSFKPFTVPLPYSTPVTHVKTSPPTSPVHPITHSHTNPFTKPQTHKHTNPETLTLKKDEYLGGNHSRLRIQYSFLTTTKELVLKPEDLSYSILIDVPDPKIIIPENLRVSQGLSWEFSIDPDIEISFDFTKFPHRIKIEVPTQKQSWDYKKIYILKPTKISILKIITIEGGGFKIDI